MYECMCGVNALRCNRHCDRETITRYCSLGNLINAFDAFFDIRICPLKT